MRRHKRRIASSDVREALRRGHRIAAPFFLIFVKKNGLAHSRFAVVVSKAVSKRAVSRNRLRRRTREWLRTHVSGIRSPADFVIIFKKEGTRASRRAMYEELRRTFEKIISSTGSE